MFVLCANGNARSFWFCAPTEESNKKYVSEYQILVRTMHRIGIVVAVDVFQSYAFSCVWMAGKRWEKEEKKNVLIHCNEYETFIFLVFWQAAKNRFPYTCSLLRFLALLLVGFAAKAMANNAFSWNIWTLRIREKAIELQSDGGGGDDGGEVTVCMCGSYRGIGCDGANVNRVVVRSFGFYVRHGAGWISSISLWSICIVCVCVCVWKWIIVSDAKGWRHHHLNKGNAYRSCVQARSFLFFYFFFASFMRFKYILCARAHVRDILCKPEQANERDVEQKRKEEKRKGTRNQRHWKENNVQIKALFFWFRFSFFSDYFIQVLCNVFSFRCVVHACVCFHLR